MWAANLWSTLKPLGFKQTLDNTYTIHQVISDACDIVSGVPLVCSGIMLLFVNFVPSA
jgi:hypothetical protein